MLLLSLSIYISLVFFLPTIEADAYTVNVNHPGEPQPDHASSDSNNKAAPSPIWGKYSVLETIPHDPDAFTQGLTTYNGKLYESTGLYGKSQLRQINPIDGTILSSQSLHKRFFAEGLTYYQTTLGKHYLLQLTWKAKIGFVYDASTLELVKEFDYDTHTGEGWGITFDTDSNRLIVSDGSEWLHFWDVDTLEEVQRIPVMIEQIHPRTKQTQSTPVTLLNELEFVNGRVLANVWYQDILVSIDPATGMVDRLVNFKGLYQDRDPKADCFNGIAKLDAPGELLVTGKLWPNMYRIKLL